MARHGWSILCARSIVDSATNQVSIIDAVDQFEIHTPEVDAMFQEALATGNQGILIPAQLTFATWWYRSEKDVPETGTARLRILNPSGLVVVDQEFSVPLETASVHRTFFEIPALKFSGFGRYNYVVEGRADATSDWIEVARLPLDVLRSYNATETTEPEPPSGLTPPAATSSSSQPEPSRPSRRQASPKPRRRRS